MKEKKKHLPDLDRAFQLYERAVEYVRTSNYQEEVCWQRDVSLDSFTESEFLRESAWVILCSGFRETVVRRVFSHISLSFCDWESAELIAQRVRVCSISASAVFSNKRKIDAIASVCCKVAHAGFSAYKQRVLDDPISKLQELPLIGPVTVWHLAKNLGMNVSKPDRHLNRISFALGFENAASFCRDIASKYREEPKVVDLIVWRYLANNPKSLQGAESLSGRWDGVAQ